MVESDSTEGSGSRGTPLTTILATLSGNTYLILGSVFFSILALLGSWLPPRGNWVYQMARLWSHGLLFFSGVQLSVEYSVPLAPQRSCIYMSNHQSLFDIPALIVSLPGQTRFLAKQSLFRIPIFGWALKAGGFISIDRKNRSRARESFRSAVSRLQEGSSTLVFPEGTRSLDGSLGPFERGGFLLALKSGLPIVPVGVIGGLAIRQRESYVIRPGRISLRYGGPLRVEDFGVRGKDELMERVRKEIVDLAEIDL